jgi:hypothetical protein
MHGIGRACWVGQAGIPQTGIGHVYGFTMEAAQRPTPSIGKRTKFGYALLA